MRAVAFAIALFLVDDYIFIPFEQYYRYFYFHLN
jgi:hypothetical protein